MIAAASSFSASGGPALPSEAHGTDHVELIAPTTREKETRLKAEFIQPPGVAASPSYTHVVTATGGTTIYVSGQVALDEAGNLVRRACSPAAGRAGGSRS